LYPQIGRAGIGHSRARQEHLPLHQRDVHPQAACTNSARTAASSSTSTWTGLEKNHDLAVEKEGVFNRGDRGNQGRQESRASWCAPTPPSIKKPDMKEIAEAVSIPEASSTWTATSSRPPTATPRSTIAKIFMTRDDIHRENSVKQKKLFKPHRLNQTPMYMEFLRGGARFGPAPLGAIRPTT